MFIFQYRVVQVDAAPSDKELRRRFVALWRVHVLQELARGDHSEQQAVAKQIVDRYDIAFGLLAPEFKVGKRSDAIRDLMQSKPQEGAWTGKGQLWDEVLQWAKQLYELGFLI